VVERIFQVGKRNGETQIAFNDQQRSSSKTHKIASGQKLPPHQGNASCVVSLIFDSGRY
jgi:hypothetical protein